MRAKASLSMSEVMEVLTLDVKITRRKEWALRIWTGINLLRLTALVLGTGIKIEVIDTAPAKKEF